MRTFTLKSLRHIILSTFLMFAAYAFADTSDDSGSAYNLTAEQNINTPLVPQKASNTMIRHMDGLSKTLTKHNFEVKKTRKGEVLKVIIPADKLFAPNATTLLPSAVPMLNAFEALVKRPKLYKLVILAHTDDTGDEIYSDNLSEVRANAIDEFFEDMALNSEANVIPYGIGFDEPLFDNHSIVNRSRNRRIEIYIIPTQQLIDMAKKGVI